MGMDFTAYQAHYLNEAPLFKKLYDKIQQTIESGDSSLMIQLRPTLLADQADLV
ncbi:hypothetical protein [Paenibacillus sp. FSL H8-0537]|uniref:hypothetical protein n=1 Tax=Paenibacillus sp. FSL H8-0537 TaxID=2921399 RepID=UPI00310170EE